MENLKGLLFISALLINVYLIGIRPLLKLARRQKCLKHKSKKAHFYHFYLNMVCSHQNSYQCLIPQFSSVQKWCFVGGFGVMGADPSRMVQCLSCICSCLPFYFPPQLALTRRSCLVQTSQAPESRTKINLFLCKSLSLRYSITETENILTQIVIREIISSHVIQPLGYTSKRIAMEKQIASKQHFENSFDIAEPCDVLGYPQSYHTHFEN